MDDKFINNNLINLHYNEILDIIGEEIKTKKQLSKNRKQIITYLQETFPDITDKKLENCFTIIYKEGLQLDLSTIKNINNSINRYVNYISQVSNQFNDYGYSMLLFGYFWITREN